MSWQWNTTAKTTTSGKLALLSNNKSDCASADDVLYLSSSYLVPIKKASDIASSISSDYKTFPYYGGCSVYKGGVEYKAMLNKACIKTSVEVSVETKSSGSTSFQLSVIAKISNIYSSVKLPAKVTITLTCSGTDSNGSSYTVTTTKTLDADSLSNTTVSSNSATLTSGRTVKTMTTKVTYTVTQWNSYPKTTTGTLTSSTKIGYSSICYITINGY